MRKLLILAHLVVLLAGLANAVDRTNYKFGFGANAAVGDNHYTITNLVECYEMGLNFGSWPGTEDSLRDTAVALGKDFWSGSYSSSNEINIYDADSLKSYADRMADTVALWLYIYAKHYLDSIGVSVESLVVHVADDMLASTMNNETVGYKYRKIDSVGIRYSYQYWRNSDADESLFHPQEHDIGTWVTCGVPQERIKLETSETNH